MGPTRRQKEKSSNNHACCVPECKSKTGHVEFKFFRVSKADQSMAEKWTKAINKKNPDGSLWHPTSNSRICGRHFQGGEPNKNSDEMNAIPTLYLPEPDPIPEQNKDKAVSL